MGVLSGDPRGAAVPEEHTRAELIRGYAFLFPLATFVAVFILVPVIGTFAGSLMQDVTFLPKRFAGAENYRAMLSDPGFWQALRFTCLFTLVSVPLELFLGLLFALLLARPSPARGLLRACVLIPWAIPAAVSGRVFQLIYNYHYGLANYLAGIFGLTGQPVSWLGTPAGAFASLVMADAWKTTPFVAIILLAGLAGIPQELYLQAEIDRAGFFRRFTRVTLPLLSPVIVVALLFRTIDALRIFDLVFVLTGGGPGGSTTSLSLYGYNYFLGGDFGFGSAVSVALFLIAFGLSVLYVRVGQFARELA
ncbi:MAG: sugar ABC transporter permease [Deltaproteobacteria bacterium]|nr:sugar ABC transporter permease [Deltaproteobacteria bacterium]